ncbi:FAD-binding oxidoreductase [Moritella sp. F3]|uniref:FAD-binding oxidoreductase n=1 Tax=Moritella sp. F3 TaxID=2718882 RepID=UPI0018E1932E|nr:FAD-binding oxidoreductase [Moritella sp. F3]GIC76316.1 FAD-binding oxidoreductase [Moritella sp. F1]GIC82896.1 FAD-binding oxidoreductase [Moritella sp. F3]
MKRWNGWGDEANKLDLPNTADAFLLAKVGTTTPLVDAQLSDVIKQVPESRLPTHRLINRDPEIRIRHARGQSLPDWLAMRSGDFEYFPDGVSFPENNDDLIELLSFCQQQHILVIPYGGGTSVAGHINPFASQQAILTVDMGRMNRLIALDTDSQLATFGAGTPGPQVESQLRAQGYTLGHFPQSFELSTIGGWVVTRSSGQQSLRYGRIEELFAGGEVITPVGLLDIPTFPASAAGPDIKALLMGSEGRIGILSTVKVRVRKLAEQENFYVTFFPSWQQAKEAAKTLVQSDIQLSMLRLSNAIETETQLALAGHGKQIALLEKALSLFGTKEGKCMMTFGLTGTAFQCSNALKQLKKITKAHQGLYTGSFMGNKWAEKRFTMPYFREALWQKGYVVDTLETATDWHNVDNLLTKIETNLRTVLAQDLNAEEAPQLHVFTHLSHFYQQGSSIYTTYIFKAGKNYKQTLAQWAKLKHSTSEIIVNNRGTISHQHGVGKDHQPYLVTEKGPLTIKAIQSLCDTFDPQQIMNPHCLIASAEVSTSELKTEVGPESKQDQVIDLNETSTQKQQQQIS